MKDRDLTVDEAVNTDTAADNSIQQFMQDMCQYPLLTDEEERALAKACAQGDEDAIKKMVACNLRLVVAIARPYASRDVPLLDLIQEGSIGLMRAARKFDYTRELKFSTYASKWIWNYVDRCVKSHSNLIEIPDNVIDNLNKVRRVKSELRQEYGDEPTTEEIAEHCQMKIRDVEKLLKDYPEVCRLDSPVGENGEDDLYVVIEDPDSFKPQEEAVHQALKNTLDVMISQLDERQQRVVRLHYGLEDGETHSFQSIAEKMGITREGARQIDVRAREKLRNIGKAYGLEDFFSD